MKPFQNFYILTQKIDNRNKQIKGCDTIAELRRAFFYFWIFGGISVLLDLDHLIVLYQNGLEFNLENIANHGTRTLHIPILILSGCICVVTFALLLRFFHIKPFDNTITNSAQISWYITEPATIKPLQNRRKNKGSYNPILSLLANSIFSLGESKVKKDIVIIECPKCNERLALKATTGLLEFPCPYCGILGYMDFSNVN